MTVKDFALVIVRLFGLWVLFTCIKYLEFLIGSLLPDPNINSEIGRLATFINLFDLLLHIAIGLLLTWKPQIVVDRLSLGDGKDTLINLSATTFMIICFSVAGLVFAVTGLSGLVYHTAQWIVAPTRPPFEGKADKAGIVTAAFQAVVGLWLLLGSRGIMQGVRRLRTFGTPEAEEGQ